MKKTGLLLMSIMGLGILVQAQDAENLVENPSFEQMEGKIKKNRFIILKFEIKHNILIKF